MKTLKIATRLALLTGSLCALLALVGGMGLVNLSRSNESLRTVYEDRVVPAAQLSEVKERTMRNQQLLLEALADPQPAATARRVAEMDANVAAITKAWQDYTSTYLTPEEKKLTQAFVDARALFVKEALLPAKEALLAGRSEEARRISLELMPARYAPLDAGLAALMQLQLDVAKAAYLDAATSYQQARWVALAAVLLAVGLAAVSGWLLSRSLTRALGAEPGEVAEVAEAVAAGDLSTAISVRAGDKSSVMAAMRRMSDSLAGTVTSVRQNAQSVASASAQIAAGNGDLSSRTEEQASALEETAASMEELASTVGHNTDNARQANELARSASAVAARGGVAVGQVVETMKGINDSSKRIADIIGVIDGIAFQTNILALNAAVEAARAGDQGRGFAVVATEVRSLARRSADAAKEIKTLINDSVERVAEGSTLVNQAGATMQEVVQSIERVGAIVGEIMNASVEQNAGVAQINEAVTQMDQATQQNAALVEQSAAAAESLKQQADQLVQAVAVFRLGTEAVPVAAATDRPADSAGWHGTERRGPDRAANVVRPAFKAARKPPAALAIAQREPATGTDGGWSSF